MLRAVARIVLPLALLGSFAGCEWLKRTVKHDDGALQQTGPIQDVQADRLVAYLNRQAGYLNSVRYPDVSISVSMDKESHTLGSSMLVCAKPRNFLLIGGKGITGDLVHIGSNSQEFWMLTKSPMQPTYVYCSHADFKQGAGQLPIPFDPDWALQALGMAGYDPKLHYEVKTDQRERRYTLTMDSTTPQGTPVKHVIVFDPTPRADESHVREHLIMDANGQMIASARVVKAARVSVGGADVQVPTRVVLEWPRQKAKMELRLGRPRVNEQMSEGEMRDLFTRPQPRDGVNPINLANAQFTPSSYRGATPNGERKRLFGRR
jgi:hypothetical protein